MNPKALAAEFFGTLWLVLGGCGTAVLATGGFGDGLGTFNSLSVGIYGVAIAFGLTVVTGAYAFGHVSGGHFNPAVTLGLVAGGKFEAAKAPMYIVSQVIGAIVGALIIFVIASGNGDFAASAGFAANGYGDLSPGGFGLGAVLITEIVLTAIFLIVILGATERRGAGGQAGLAIGLTLALIHLISIPVSNTSVNPARSTSQAIFAGGDFLPQLWMFWVAPIVGAVIGGLIHAMLLTTDDDPAFA